MMINVSFLMGFITVLNGVTNTLVYTIQVPSVIGAAGTTKVAADRRCTASGYSCSCSR